jgi:hypothetical protein
MSSTATTASPSRVDAPGRPGAVLLLVCVAIFMLMLDATVLTAALSDIRSQFDTSIDGLQWVVDAYSIPLVGRNEGAPPQPPTVVAPVPNPGTPPATLVPGQTLTLPEEAWHGLLIAFTFAGADADLTLFLTDAESRVSSDEDFVFYNQPSAAQGAARLLGKQVEGQHTVERAAVHLAALPAHIHRVAVAINMDVDTGLTCGALTHASL